MAAVEIPGDEQAFLAYVQAGGQVANEPLGE